MHFWSLDFPSFHSASVYGSSCKCRRKAVSALCGLWVVFDKRERLVVDWWDVDAYFTEIVLPGVWAGQCASRSKATRCQADMQWNTPRSRSAAKSAATNPDVLPVEPIPRWPSRFGQLRQGTATQPSDCTIGVVGLERSSISKPYLRAHARFFDRGQFAEQSRLLLIFHGVLSMDLVPAPLVYRVVRIHIVFFVASSIL